MGDASFAVIELRQDTFARDDHFQRAAERALFGENQVGVIGVDEAGIVDFQAVGFDEVVRFLQCRQYDADVV